MSKEVAKKFIKQLIIELKKADKTMDEICFMVAPLSSSLNRATVFIDDISNNHYTFTQFNRDETGGYTNGEISITIPNAKHTYNLYFEFENRPYNYCTCNETKHDFNVSKNCCGVNCDWIAPKYILEKVDSIIEGKWEGLEKDFWDFEDSFKENEFFTDFDYKRTQKELKKKELQDKINSLQEQLRNLA